MWKAARIGRNVRPNYSPNCCGKVPPCGRWAAIEQESGRPVALWWTTVSLGSSPEQRVALAQEGGAVNQDVHFVARDGALLGHDRVHELGRCEVEELAHLARKLASLGALDRGELDHLAGDDRRYLLLGRRLRERPRADLVAEGAVAEDRVGTDKKERCAGEFRRRFLVLHKLDGETAGAELVGEGPALLDRVGDGADEELRRRVQDGLAHGRRGRVRDDQRALESLAELDRNRGSRAAAARDQRLRLLLDQATKLRRREMGLGARGREQPPNSAGNSGDPRPGLGQLPGGARHPFEQLLARRRRRLGHLNEGLDRAPGEKARSVTAIGTELLQPLRKLHAPILRSPRRARKHTRSPRPRNAAPTRRVAEAQIGRTSETPRVQETKRLWSAQLPNAARRSRRRTVTKRPAPRSTTSSTETGRSLGYGLVSGAPRADGRPDEDIYVLDVQQGRITYQRPGEWEKMQPGYVDTHHSDKPYFKL
jgi:hypothetical protein